MNLKISEEGLEIFKDSLIQFCKYRKEIGDAYKTTYGINGLIKDSQACLQAGLDLQACIETSMEKEWKAVKPEYFKNGNHKTVINAPVKIEKTPDEIEKAFLKEYGLA